MEKEDSSSKSSNKVWDGRSDDRYGNAEYALLEMQKKSAPAKSEMPMAAMSRRLHFRNTLEIFSFGKLQRRKIIWRSLKNPMVKDDQMACTNTG